MARSNDKASFQLILTLFISSLLVFSVSLSQESLKKNIFIACWLAQVWLTLGCQSQYLPLPGQADPYVVQNQVLIALKTYLQHQLKCLPKS